MKASWSTWRDLLLWSAALAVASLPWLEAGGLASEPARWWSTAGLAWGLWTGMLAGGAARRRRDPAGPRRRRRAPTGAPRPALLAAALLALAIAVADVLAGLWWSLVVLRAALALAAGHDLGGRLWPRIRPDARIRAEEEEPDFDPHPRRRRPPPGSGSDARPRGWERR